MTGVLTTILLLLVGAWVAETALFLLSYRAAVQAEDDGTSDLEREEVYLLERGAAGGNGTVAPAIDRGSPAARHESRL